MFFRNSRRMHFIGIGGIGMSGIAEILINLGFEVSGSDLRESDQTRRLAELGATIFTGHRTANIEDYNVVITSSAIDPSNPEIVEARRRHIPIIHRSEMLAELVRLKHGIGVAGTHGKTTTSSMLSFVLDHGGINPTAVIGGKVLNFGTNARVGEGEYIVFEADESDGTFLHLFPTIGIVTNIDADHLDHYKYLEGLKDAFLTYMNHIPFYGYSVLCMDDPAVRELLDRVERPYVTYGFHPDADIRGSDLRFEDGRMVYRCSYRGEDIGDMALGQLGHHNAVNSLAVVAVALELGLSVEAVREGLRDFQGVGRRLERKGEEKGILVMDDYGHHPTEIRATLEAASRLGRRIIAVFQPHRYSRTELLWEDFGQSFGRADEVLLAEIYPAGEAPIEGVNSSLIAGAIEKHEGRGVEVIEKLEELPAKVVEMAREGDLVLTLGAGDIYRSGAEILELIKKGK